jgi:hypothetical protein
MFVKNIMRAMTKMVRTKKVYPMINPAKAILLPMSSGFLLHSERAVWPKIIAGIKPRGPINIERHERLKDTTAKTEYLDLGRFVKESISKRVLPSLKKNKGHQFQ